jgi:malonyl CoA-acyl carrier protein transacylase
MQSAVATGVGAMVAISAGEGLDIPHVRELAARYEVDVANENSLAQVVLSGEANAVKRAVEELLENSPGLKATWLNVSAPFHSRLMARVEPPFRTALEAEQARWCPEKATAVASNFTGACYSGDVDDLINGLTRQISSPVRWIDNMRTLNERADKIIEIGPNRPLRRFFSTLDISVQSVIDLRSALRLQEKER